MTTNVHRESARIYTFPARGRFADTGQDRKGSEDNATRTAAAAPGSAWYHEEAIREMEPSRKN